MIRLPDPSLAARRHEAVHSMEHETQHEERSTDNVWQQVQDILSRDCSQEDHIDDILRDYLALLDQYDDQLQSEPALNHCAYLLYSSDLYNANTDYIQRQLAYCLLQEVDTLNTQVDDSSDNQRDHSVCTLRLIVTFLLGSIDGQQQTIHLLSEERIFPGLTELIAHPQKHDSHTHRMLMELLYEMARRHEITIDDLGEPPFMLSLCICLTLTVLSACIDDDFVQTLFQVIEQASEDVQDPYHYPVIRVLVGLSPCSQPLLTLAACPQ